MGTVQENGARLQSMGEQVKNSVNGAKANVSAALNDAVAALEQCKEAAEGPVAEVAAMLGEDHMGTTALTGASGLVSAAVEAVMAVVQQANVDLINISSAADTLGFAYINVGQDIQRAQG